MSLRALTDFKIIFSFLFFVCLGSSEEQASAATLFILLCIQLGGGDEAEEGFKMLRPILTTILMDNSASMAARQSVREQHVKQNFISFCRSMKCIRTHENIFFWSFYFLFFEVGSVAVNQIQLLTINMKNRISNMSFGSLRSQFRFFSWAQMRCICVWIIAALKWTSFYLCQCARALGMCCYVSTAEEGEVRWVLD